MSHERKVFNKKYYNGKKECEMNIDEVETEDGEIMYSFNLSEKYRGSDFFTSNINFNLDEGKIREMFQALSNEIDHLSIIPKPIAPDYATGGIISAEEMKRIALSSPLITTPMSVERISMDNKEKEELIIPLVWFNEATDVDRIEETLKNIETRLADENVNKYMVSSLNWMKKKLQDDLNQYKKINGDESHE